MEHEKINIKDSIDLESIKKIFANKTNEEKYLLELKTKLNNALLDQKFKVLKSGKNKGKYSLKDKKETSNLIKDFWNYSVAKDIIRRIFADTDKYKNGESASVKYEIFIKEWVNLKLGELKWPCSQGEFDSLVQKINSKKITTSEKDKEVEKDAIKYRRIKELNTLKNDYLEFLIFENHKNIIPTLSHSKGVDFFIDGISYDQKVAKSPTNEFKENFGNQWKEEAIKNPSEVAKYLYTYQDEGRFGYSPRLYIVYLDEDIKPIDIQNRINGIDLEKPLEISFTYSHKDKDIVDKEYKTQAYVVLLYRR